MEGWCMKCKAQVEMKDPRQDQMKNGKPMVRATCISCGTKMCKIGKLE